LKSASGFVGRSGFFPRLRCCGAAMGCVRERARFFAVFAALCCAVSAVVVVLRMLCVGPAWGCVLRRLLIRAVRFGEEARAAPGFRAGLRACARAGRRRRCCAVGAAAGSGLRESERESVESTDRNRSDGIGWFGWELG